MGQHRRRAECEEFALDAALADRLPGAEHRLGREYRILRVGDVLPPAYSSTKRRYARMATESGRGGRPHLATAAQRHDLGVVAAFHERRDFIAEPAPVRPDTLAGQRDVAGRHGG